MLRVSSWATRVFAVRDLRLLGVQLETKGREPVGDQVPKGPGLSLSVAVDNDVVRLCRAPDYAASECVRAGGGVGEVFGDGIIPALPAR